MLEFHDIEGMQQFVRFKLLLKVRDVVAILKLRWHWNILLLLLLKCVWIEMHIGIQSRWYWILQIVSNFGKPPWDCQWKMIFVQIRHALMNIWNIFLLGDNFFPILLLWWLIDWVTDQFYFLWLGQMAVWGDVKIIRGRYTSRNIIFYKINFPEDSSLA